MFYNLPERGHGESVSLQGHQATQAAGQAAAVTGRGVPFLHQPPHGLNTIMHGHQLPQDPDISRTQAALHGERTLGSVTPVRQVNHSTADSDIDCHQAGSQQNALSFLVETKRKNEQT